MEGAPTPATPTPATPATPTPNPNQGTSEAQGDLKSVVLHKMAVASQRNTFPIALGVRIAGVDDATYSQTGEAYSTVALPETDVHTSRTLQEEDTSLAYEA